jgi:predicted DNA-binding transcriptional regulator YafY
MIEDMILAGLAVGTQKIYTQAVYRLAAHYRRSPDQLSEEEVRAYLLGLRQLFRLWRLSSPHASKNPKSARVIRCERLFWQG